LRFLDSRLFNSPSAVVADDARSLLIASLMIKRTEAQADVERALCPRRCNCIMRAL